MEWGLFMSEETRKSAGWLIIILPTVIIGGVSILSLLIGSPAYQENPLRQDLWRAGHAHAGILLILSLVSFLYIDRTNWSKQMKRLIRSAIPASAILLPMAFFFSVLTPDATEPNGFIYLAYVGAFSLAAGLILLGIGLIRKPAEVEVNSNQNQFKMEDSN